MSLKPKTRNRGDKDFGWTLQNHQQVQSEAGRVRPLWAPSTGRLMPPTATNATSVYCFSPLLHGVTAELSGNEPSADRACSSPVGYTPWMHFLHKDINPSQALASQSQHTESKASGWWAFYIYILNVPALKKGGEDGSQRGKKKPMLYI